MGSLIRRRAFVVAAALAAMAAATHAHEEAALDLAALNDHVTAQAAATALGPSKKVHAAWVRVGRALAREDLPGLADDLKKLSAAAKESSKTLLADVTLKNLIDDVVEEAEHLLGEGPDEAEGLIDGVVEKGRRRLEKVAVRARDSFLEGRSPAHTLRKRLAYWIRAAKGFTKLDRLAEKALDKQGGPIPSTFPAEPGTVYTVAGNGAGGFNGDGRPARRTSLYWAEEVKFGPDGLLHVLDWNNHMLRRIEADGTVTRICGSGTPGDSEGDPLATELNHPSAVDFDAEGRIYIAAWHNHKVKVFDPTGVEPTVYTIAGTVQGNDGDGGAATAAKFNLLPGILRLPADHPWGAGDLLATDAANQCVRIIRVGTDPVTATNVAGVEVVTGSVDRFWGTGFQGHGGDDGPAEDAQLGFSKAQNAESDGRMTMDAEGNVFLVSGVEHVIRRIDVDGTITTAAGNGTGGFSGDGGDATDASLDFPSDVAVAPDGTLFVSDQNNQVIRRVAPDGTISTFAGVPGTTGYEGDGGAPGAALLHRPTGLELDAAGNLWFCDKGNSVVRVATSAAPGGLMVPRSPYVLPAAKLGRPPRKGPAGTIDTYAGTGISAFNGDGRPARETAFYWPQDVAVQPATGLLYVVDWNNHRIRRVEDDGRVRTVVGVGELGDTDGPALEVRMNHPTDIAFHPLDGELWFASWHTDKVKRVQSSDNTVVPVSKPDGKRAFTGDEGPVALAELNLPASVKFDSAGNFFIADEGNRRVRRVDASSTFIDTVLGTGVAGFFGDDGPGVDAMLNLPVGQSAQPAGKVCVDPANLWLYVADTNNHRIRRLSLTDWTVTTVAGNGVAAYTGDGLAATAASLHSPVDVDCDAAGNLYICDRDNHAVRRVELATGIITTVAGGAGQGYEGDEGPATAALLNLPSGIFVDRATGRLFIADTFNSVVRVVWE